MIKREKRAKKANGMRVLSLLLSVLVIGFFVSGCNSSQKANDDIDIYDAGSTEAVNVPLDTGIELAAASTTAQPTKMVSYDVSTIGRSDPFMPYGEIAAYDLARQSAISEAVAHNSEIARLKALQNKAVREADDISPYSFNLPVPPTSLSTGSVAAKITKTKVVGIMYNAESPSAIINVDDKDYLVRTGDKIIGQEYKVAQINPTWITVTMGSNIYSAAIGELFTKDDIYKNQNDVYNLKNRFGGRKG